jgi:lipopolysaccharide export system protein LptA
MTTRKRAIQYIVTLLLISSSNSGIGQNIGPSGQSHPVPIQIQADEGIKWDQKRQVYIAKGNAFAQQGENSLHADLLYAWYVRLDGKTSKIFKINAEGNVSIKSPEHSAYGKKGLYLIDKGLMVLTGNPKLLTSSEKITAGDSIEFWNLKNLAIARGDATIFRGTQRMRADVLTAYLAKQKNGETTLESIEADNNVLISTATQIIRAERGSYNVAAGIIQLFKNVRITRGESQLNGDRALVDLNTGTSQIFGTGTDRVRGFIVPERNSSGSGVLGRESKPWKQIIK